MSESPKPVESFGGCPKCKSAFHVGADGGLYCPNCDPPKSSDLAKYRDVGLRVDRYGNVVFRPELATD